MPGPRQPGPQLNETLCAYRFIEIVQLRTRVLFELVSLAAGTVLFLLLFPNRTTVVNMTLAALAMLGLVANRRFTRDRIWARFPTHGDRSERRRKASKAVAVITSVGVLVFLVTGAVLGYRQAGWPGVAQRFTNWNILIAFAAYLPWALLQQALFQFYLLGRLLVIQKTWAAIVLTGLA